MPTYTYRCTVCGHQFDIFQKFADAPLTECPECQSPLKKVLHPVGVVFKGSGWYITDSRPSQPSEGGGSDKSEKTDKPGKSDDKESKTSDSAKTSETATPAAATAKTEAKPKAAASSDS